LWLREAGYNDSDAAGLRERVMPVDPDLWQVPSFFSAERIVNNESAEIIRMLNTEFNELAKNPGLDLYPEHLRSAIDATNDWVCTYRSALKVVRSKRTLRHGHQQTLSSCIVDEAIT
jgi:hypothetical protein